MVTIGSTASPSRPSSHDPRRTQFAAGIVFALTVIRWLVPTEATAEGETLWIALLWFAAGAVLWGALYRESFRRWDWADLAVGLLIGGQVTGGLVIVFGTGDRRAAVNLVWEWLSLGVLWFAWRELLARVEIRRQLSLFLMTTAATLAVWGVWQYFVWYPQTAAEFAPLFTQADQAEANGVDAAGIYQQLSTAGIPTDPSSRLIFKNRLLHSREPFGPFALANTYGGLLAAWLVLGAGMFGSSLSKSFRRLTSMEHSPPLPGPLPRGGGEGTKRTPAIGRLVGCGGLLLLIALALYLTNSRTAWVGTFAVSLVGLVLWAARRSNSMRLKRWLFPAAVVAGCLAGLAILAVILRDERSVPGPLKSLAYRAEYWIGTVLMLRTSPGWGVGPGQFRDRYLAFKIPESSEEIADPHNLLLDVWASGGVMGVTGLIALLGLLLFRLNQPSQSVERMTSSPPSALWRIAGVTGFLLAIAVPVLSTGLWDSSTDRLAVFGIVWFGLSWAIPRFCGDERNDLSGFASLAALALSIHLLGAGGIGMPAVTQLWLLLVAWVLTPVATHTAISTKFHFGNWGMAAACGVLVVACFLTGYRPVTLAQRELLQGDTAWSTRGDARAAERHFRAAANADGLSPEPWQRLAELEFSRGDYPAAVTAIDEALQRAPQRAAFWKRKGQMWASSARRPRGNNDWLAAVEAFQTATTRHPTDAWLLAEFAEALSQTNTPAGATAMAQRAINQDDLNHRRGHTDQYLSARIRQQMERLAKAAETVPMPKN